MFEKDHAPVSFMSKILATESAEAPAQSSTGPFTRDEHAPSREKYFLGIDGGGTKTTALLAEAGGGVLGRGQTGSSNYHAVGAATAFDTLREAVHAAALRSAGKVLW